VVRGGNFWPPHLAIVQDIASQTGARYIAPEQQPDWVDEDFRDPIHLDRPGQRKITTLLIEALQ